MKVFQSASSLKYSGKVELDLSYSNDLVWVLIKTIVTVVLATP